MACAAADANADGTGGYILRDDASAVAAWTFAFGGDVLTEDGTGYVYNDQATVEAMTFLKEVYDDGCAYFFTEGYPNPEFAARRAIFTQGSSSGLPFYMGDVATVADAAAIEPSSASPCTMAVCRCRTRGIVRASTARNASSPPAWPRRRSARPPTRSGS